MVRGLSGGSPCVTWTVWLGLVRAVMAEVAMVLQVQMGVGPANPNNSHYYYSYCLSSIYYSPIVLFNFH